VDQCYAEAKDCASGRIAEEIMEGAKGREKGVEEKGNEVMGWDWKMNIDYTLKLS